LIVKTKTKIKNHVRDNVKEKIYPQDLPIGEIAELGISRNTASKYVAILEAERK